MQNSLSKFHHLSFQSSKFEFYHFSPLNFIFFSIKFSVHHPLLATIIFSCYSFITFHLQLFLKKKNLFTYSFCINLVLCLSLNRVQFRYSNLNLVLCLLPLSTPRSLFSLFPSLDLSISLSLPFPPLSPSQSLNIRWGLNFVLRYCSPNTIPFL